MKQTKSDPVETARAIVNKYLARDVRETQRPSPRAVAAMLIWFLSCIAIFAAIVLWQVSTH
jgi:hypothetical protein